MLCKHMNIARLLRYNVCLICVLGYFLFKVNVEKETSFETDGLVLKNVSYLEMVKGQGGQRIRFLSEIQTCFLGIERLSVCKLLQFIGVVLTMGLLLCKKQTYISFAFGTYIHG